MIKNDKLQICYFKQTGTSCIEFYELKPRGLRLSESDYHIQRQRRGKLQKCAGTYESERQTGRKPCTKDRWSGRKTGCRIFKWITSDDFIIK